VNSASSGQSFTDLLSALSEDAANPAATLTDLANAISSAGSAAYSTLLPLADIGNALLTSLPAYTLFAGFALAVIDHAATQIAGDFSGLF
jgi:hypothetical protein